jgi:cytochrome b561
MQLTNTTANYGLIDRSFHWLMALLILSMIPLGKWANLAPFTNDAEFARKFMLFSIHKTLGVTLFGLALLRILWAIWQPKPGVLHPERRAENLAAAVVHWLLYSALVLVPLTGWIEHAAMPGLAPIWWPFGQSLPFVTASEAMFNLFSALHRAFGMVLILAIVLHIAGALKHQLFDKDATLRRMWSGAARDATAERPGNLIPAGLAMLVWLAAVGLGVMFGQN